MFIGGIIVNFFSHYIFSKSENTRNDKYSFALESNKEGLVRIVLGMKGLNPIPLLDREEKSRVRDILSDEHMRVSDKAVNIASALSPLLESAKLNLKERKQVKVWRTGSWGVGACNPLTYEGISYDVAKMVRLCVECSEELENLLEGEVEEKSLTLNREIEWSVAKEENLAEPPVKLARLVKGKRNFTLISLARLLVNDYLFVKSQALFTDGREVFIPTELELQLSIKTGWIEGGFAYMRAFGATLSALVNQKLSCE